MTAKEASNIIIRLSELGLTNKQINEFIGFIETHNPTAEEVQQAVDKAEKTTQDKN